MKKQRLENLNRIMEALEKSGDITEEEYATYKWHLRWLEFTSAYVGDRIPIREAKQIMGELE